MEPGEHIGDLTGNWQGRRAAGRGLSPSGVSIDPMGPMSVCMITVSVIAWCYDDLKLIRSLKATSEYFYEDVDFARIQDEHVTSRQGGECLRWPARAV